MKKEKNEKNSLKKEVVMKAVTPFVVDLKRPVNRVETEQSLSRKKPKNLLPVLQDDYERRSNYKAFVETCSVGVPWICV